MTGLLLKAPTTPVGNPVIVSVTGALNEPWDWTPMLTIADCPDCP